MSFTIPDPIIGKSLDRLFTSATYYGGKQTFPLFPIIYWRRLHQQYTAYRIAGNIRGRKLLRFGRNKIFAEKTFVNSYKNSKSAEVFSVESFALYGVVAVVELYETVIVRSKVFVAQHCITCRKPPHSLAMIRLHCPFKCSHKTNFLRKKDTEVVIEA